MTDENDLWDRIKADPDVVAAQAALEAHDAEEERLVRNLGAAIGRASRRERKRTIPSDCIHCGQARSKHSEDREACVKAGYYGNRFTPSIPPAKTCEACGQSLEWYGPGEPHVCTEREGDSD